VTLTDALNPLFLMSNQVPMPPIRPHNGQTPFAFITWLLAVFSPLIWVQAFRGLFPAFLLGIVCIFGASLWLSHARSSLSSWVLLGCGGLLLSAAIFFLGCVIAVGGAY
jgi:hypothetical protein